MGCVQDEHSGQILSRCLHPHEAWLFLSAATLGECSKHLLLKNPPVALWLLDFRDWLVPHGYSWQVGKEGPEGLGQRQWSLHGVPSPSMHRETGL